MWLVRLPFAGAKRIEVCKDEEGEASDDEKDTRDALGEIGAEAPTRGCEFPSFVRMQEIPDAWKADEFCDQMWTRRVDTETTFVETDDGVLRGRSIDGSKSIVLLSSL